MTLAGQAPAPESAAAMEARVRADFAKQQAMALIGARMESVRAGEVQIDLPFRPDLGQQHGFFHAGMIAAVADSAGGYAALTRMPPGSEVLTVEFKLNLLAPAAGERAVAHGSVLRAGRTLTVCQITVDVHTPEGTKRCAVGLQTLVRREPADLRRA